MKCFRSILLLGSVNRKYKFNQMHTAGVAWCGIMTADQRAGSIRGGCGARGRCGHRGGLLASMRMPVMMMPVVACRCGRCRAEQVIQDVNDGANVPLRPTVSVLEGRVQRAAERAGIHALAMMMHTLYYRALPASRVLLNLKIHVRFYATSMSMSLLFHVR